MCEAARVPSLTPREVTPREIAMSVLQEAAQELRAQAVFSGAEP